MTFSEELTTYLGTVNGFKEPGIDELAITNFLHVASYKIHQLVDLLRSIRRLDYFTSTDSEKEAHDELLIGGLTRAIIHHYRTEIKEFEDYALHSDYADLKETGRYTHVLEILDLGIEPYLIKDHIYGGVNTFVATILYYNGVTVPLSDSIDKCSLYPSNEYYTEFYISSVIFKKVVERVTVELKELAERVDKAAKIQAIREVANSVIADLHYNDMVHLIYLEVKDKYTDQEIRYEVKDIIRKKVIKLLKDYITLLE